MNKTLKIVLTAAAGAVVMCTAAFASITGCTVTSATIVRDPNNTEFNTMMANCDTITIEDLLEIDHENGLVVPDDKTFVFSRTSGKRGQIKANSMMMLGNVTIKLTPMENSALTGAWPAKSELKNSPAELITITNTNGYMDPSIMDLFKKYETDAEWVNFWKAGYYIGKKTDPDNGKIKAVTLSYSEPSPDPTSGDTSGDVDDGGGGCNIGWSVFGLLGIGLLTLKCGSGRDIL